MEPKVAASAQRKSNIPMDMETPRRRVDLNMIISEVEKVFRTVVEDEIVLRVKLDRALRLSSVPPRKIEAVLVNLFMRARDAMPPGGELIVITSNLDLDQTAASEVSLSSGAYILIELSLKGSLNVPADVRDTILQAHGAIWVQQAPGPECIVRIALPEVSRPGPLTSF